MPGAVRSLNFGINISVKELGRIQSLAKELREFSQAANQAVGAIAAINQVGKTIDPKNIGNAATAFEQLSQAFERIKATGTTGGMGGLKQSLDGAIASGKVLKQDIPELIRQYANVNKEASKISTSLKATEELRETKRLVDDVRNATRNLDRDAEKHLRTRQKITQANKEGVAVTQSQVNQAKRVVEKYDVLDKTILKNLEKLWNLIHLAKQLGLDVNKVGINYLIAANEAQKLTAELEKEAQAAQRILDLSKKATQAASESARIQKTASTEIKNSQNALNKAKIKSIELEAAVAKIERQRAGVAQTREQIVRAPVFGTKGIEGQKQAVEAANTALKAYDEQIKISNELVKRYTQVQEASARVIAAATSLKGMAAMEERAAQKLVAQGYTESAAKALEASQKRVATQQKNLELAKRELEARRRAFAEFEAYARREKQAQQSVIATSQKVITAQQKEVGLLNRLNEGLGRVIATQLKYFAATIIIFGAISKINRAFESLIEVSGRTARAFAVSRSATLLFQERYEALADAIQMTSARTGISINDVSEAVFQFGSAGLQAEESIAALESTMNLIQATGAEVTTTTKTIAATFRLMRGQLEGTGDDTAKFARINDVIAATYRDNQVEIADFTQAMKFALPVSRQLNLNLEQTSGIIALLHNNFIRGGESGRALRVIFSRMSREMDQFSEAFGIAIDPNKPLDFLDVMQQISQRMKTGAITADQVGVVFERLGLRGANAFIILAQQFEELTNTIGKLEDSATGSAEAMALIRRESDEGQLKVFTENMLRLGRAAVTPLAALLLELVRAINSFADAIRGTWIETAIGALTGLLAILLALKVATIAYTLVVGRLGLSFVFLSKEGIGAAIVAIQLWSTYLKMSAVQAWATIKSIIALNGVLRGTAIIAKEAAVALIAAFPKLLIVAAIGAVIYGIYRMVTATERLIEENKKRLAQIRQEKQERKGQIDVIDKTIDKLEEINQAYKEGRTTVLETQKAISEAVRAHGELGVAAATAGDNIELFIDKVAQQRDEIGKLLDKLKEEEKEKYGESVRALAADIKAAKGEFEGLSNLMEMGFPDPFGYVEWRLGTLQKRASKSALELDKLARSNGELAKEFGDVILEAYGMAASLNATTESADQFGKVLEYLRNTAINLSDLPLREKIDELGRVVSGLEGLRLKFLFKYDFIIPEQEIQDAKQEIQDAINKIELLTRSSREIKVALIYEDEDFALNTELARKNADQLAGITNAALREATKGLDLAEYITVDEQEILTLFEAVAENAELTKKGFKEGSEEANKFAENTKKIDDSQRSLLMQAQMYAKNEDDLKVIEAGINSIFEDRVSLFEYLLVLQNRQIAAATASDLQLNAEVKLLQKTRDLSLNTTNNLQDQVDATAEQVTETGKLYRGSVANEEIARNNLETIKESRDGILGMVRYMLSHKKASSEVEKTEKDRGERYESHRRSLEEHAKSLLAQANWIHQMNLEIEKADDAQRKINLYGEDRVSQIRAELVHQQTLIREEKRYLKDLMDRRIILEDQRILDAKDRELKAKTAELAKQETEELFKQNLQILKQNNSLELSLASNSKILKARQDILETDAELSKEVSDYNKILAKIKKGNDAEYRLGRQREVLEGKISELIGKRAKQVIAAFEQEKNIRNAFLDQLNLMEQMNLELENAKDIKDQSLIATEEEIISANKLAQVQNEINVIEKERQLQGESEIERRLRLNELYTRQAGIIKDDIVKQEQKLRTIREAQIELVNSVNDLYGKQLDNISDVGDALENALSPLAEFDFDQRPFSSALFASKALGKSFLEIAQLSPQDVISELNRGLREGTVDFRIFTGEARILAEHLTRIGAEERELRRAQEDIRAAKFATDLLKVRRALSSKDIEEARKAFDRLGESAQVLDPVTGKVDYDATQKNLRLLKTIANEIAIAYKQTGDTTEQNLRNLQTRLRDIYTSIQEITTKITDQLNNTHFADAFFEQMTSIIRQLKDLDGTEITFKIDDVTAQLARMNVFAPIPTEYQKGGPVGGTGRGDIVPAMLEPGEFVIPRNIVETFGTEFFEKFRNPAFVKKLASINRLPFKKYQDGGEVFDEELARGFKVLPTSIYRDKISIIKELQDLRYVAPGIDELERIAKEFTLTELKNMLQELYIEIEIKNDLISQLQDLRYVAPGMAERERVMNEFSLVDLKQMLDEAKGIKNTIDEAIVGAPGFQVGGKVPGFGSGDIVPALLEPGEFVVRKDVVDKLGLGFFNNLNRYQEGGVAGFEKTIYPATADDWIREIEQEKIVGKTRLRVEDIIKDPNLAKAFFFDEAVAEKEIAKYHDILTSMFDFNRLIEEVKKKFKANFNFDPETIDIGNTHLDVLFHAINTAAKKFGFSSLSTLGIYYPSSALSFLKGDYQRGWAYRVRKGDTNEIKNYNNDVVENMASIPSNAIKYFKSDRNGKLTSLKFDYLDMFLKHIQDQYRTKLSTILETQDFVLGQLSNIDIGSFLDVEKKSQSNFRNKGEELRSRLGIVLGFRSDELETVVDNYFENIGKIDSNDMRRSGIREKYGDEFLQKLDSMMIDKAFGNDTIKTIDDEENRIQGIIRTLPKLRNLRRPPEPDSTVVEKVLEKARWVQSVNEQFYDPTALEAKIAQFDEALAQFDRDWAAFEATGEVFDTTDFEAGVNKYAKIIEEWGNNFLREKEKIEQIEQQIVEEGLAEAPGFQMGGRIPGSGSGDIVPAMLEPGEFVVRKDVVDKLGLKYFEDLNRYQVGGIVAQEARAFTGTVEIEKMDFKQLIEGINALGFELKENQASMNDLATLRELYIDLSFREIEERRKLAEEERKRGEETKELNDTIILEATKRGATPIIEQAKALGGGIEATSNILEMSQEGYKALFVETYEALDLMSDKLVEMYIRNGMRAYDALATAADYYEDVASEAYDTYQSSREERATEERLGRPNVAFGEVPLGQREDILRKANIDAILSLNTTLNASERLQEERLLQDKNVYELNKIFIQQNREMTSVLAKPSGFVSERGVDVEKEKLANTILEFNKGIDKYEMLSQKYDLLNKTIGELNNILREKSAPASKQAIAGLQTGGYIPGSGIGDIVPALLEPGEFVIRKDVVNKLGLRFFEDLNRYQMGGIVGYQAGGQVNTNQLAAEITDVVVKAFEDVNVQRLEFEPQQVTIVSTKELEAIGQTDPEKFAQDIVDTLVKIATTRREEFEPIEIVSNEQRLQIVELVTKLSEMGAIEPGQEARVAQQLPLNELKEFLAFAKESQIKNVEDAKEVANIIAKLSEIGAIEPGQEERVALEFPLNELKEFLAFAKESQKKNIETANIIKQLSEAGIIQPGQEARVAKEFPLNELRELLAFSKEIDKRNIEIAEIMKQLSESGIVKPGQEERVAQEFPLNELRELLAFSKENADNTKEIIDVLKESRREEIVKGPGFQTGGRIPGIGIGDIVPALLEPGEFVIRKDVVDKLGLGFFENLNRYQTGGRVRTIIGEPTIEEEVRTIIGEIRFEDVPEVSLKIGDIKFSEDAQRKIDEISDIVIEVGDVKIDNQVVADLGEFADQIGVEVAAAPGFQIGGPVPGMGTGDIIPALLEPGEFVIRKDVVDKLGVGFFNNLNRFKTGGFLGMQAGSPGIDVTYPAIEINLTTDLPDDIEEAISNGGFVLSSHLDKSIRGLSDIELGFADIQIGGDFNLDILSETFKGVTEETEKTKENLASISEETDKTTKSTEETKKNIEKIKNELKLSETLNKQFVEQLIKVAKAENIDTSKWSNLVELARGLEIDPIILTQMSNLATETNSTSVAINSLSQESQGYMYQINEVIKSVGKGAIPVGRAIEGVRSIIGKFQSEVSNANREVVQFSDAFFGAFGTKIRKAIESISKLLQDTFGRILPNVFGGFLDSFINTQVEIVAAADEAAKQAIESYYDARADLVESLKRNEISYFDYFNKLEDLNKDTEDSMADAAIEAEQRRIEAIGDAMVGLTESIVQEINKWIGAFDDFFKGVVDGFVEIGMDIADSLDDIFGFIGNLIETGVTAIGAAGGGGIAAAIGGVAGTAVAPVVGTAIGAGAGVAIGSILGGTIGSALKTVIPIVGDLITAFEQFISTAIQGILSLVPYIVELGTMTDDEYKALIETIATLPEFIIKFINQFTTRLPEVIDTIIAGLPNIVDALISTEEISAIDSETGELVTSMKGAIPSVLEAVTEQLPKAIAAAYPEIFKFFISLADQLPGLITSAFQALAQSLTDILRSGDIINVGKALIEGLASVMGSLATDLIEPLAREFRTYGPTIITALSDSIVENIDIIVKAIVDIIMAIISVLRDPAVQDAIKAATFALLGAVFDAFRELIPGFDMFVIILGALVLAIGGVVGIIGGGLIGSLTGILLVLSPMIVALVLANTAILAIAAVIVTVLLPPLTALIGFFGILASIIIGLTLKPLIDLFQFFGDVVDSVGKKLKQNEKVQEAFARIQEAFSQLGDAVGRLFEALGPDKADPNLINGVADAIVTVIEVLLLFLVPIEISIRILTEMIDVMADVIDGLGSLFHIFQLIDNILTRESVVPSLEMLYAVLVSVDQIVKTLGSTFSNAIQYVLQFSADILSNFAPFNTLSDTMLAALDPVQQLADLIQGAFTTAMNDFIGLINDIIDMIPSLEDAGNAVTETASDLNEAGGNRLAEAGNQLSEGDVVGAFGTVTGLYHKGGIFSAPTDPQTQEFYRTLGLRPNEGLALLMDKEGILTQQGVNTLGGASVVSQLNQGQNPFLDNAALQTSIMAADMLNQTAMTAEEGVGLTVGDIENVGEPIGKRSGGGTTNVNQETTIEVNIDMSSSNFQSETVAQDVEEKIVRSMQNREGAMFKEIDSKYNNDTMSGVKRR